MKVMTIGSNYDGQSVRRLLRLFGPMRALFGCGSTQSSPENSLIGDEAPKCPEKAVLDLRYQLAPRRQELMVLLVGRRRRWRSMMEQCYPIVRSAKSSR